MASIRDTFSGSVRGLDVRPDRVDFRDRPYRPPLASLPPEYPHKDLHEQFLPQYLEDGYILDQGSEGACTGFGLAAVINYIHWERYQVDLLSGRVPEKPQRVSSHMLYNHARLYDEWDGEDYSGSSCRGAMKGWHKHGVCREDLFPSPGSVADIPPERWQKDAVERPLGAYYRVDTHSLNDLQAAILETHAVYASAKVHDGWSLAKADRFEDAVIQQNGSDPTGGHAFALVGYTRFGLVVQNSWGGDWGYKGFALLPYDDWVRNGFDLWVAAVGAPVEALSVPQVKSTSSLMKGAEAAARPGTMPARSAPATRIWSEAEAYSHSIVSGNDGRLLRRLPEAGDAEHNLRVIFDHARKKITGEKRQHLVFYAHGGLTNEDHAIRHIRKVGPNFEKNGIHPVFFVWKTGILESLKYIAGDFLTRITGREEDLRAEGVLQDIADILKEKRDRTFELAARQLVGRAIWSQIKQNAAEAASGDGTIRQVTGHVRSLLKEVPELSLHMVGHSAGSIWLGHMCEDFRQARMADTGNPPVDSLTLWAPACTVSFADRYFGLPTEKGVIAPKAMHVDLLDDELERADHVAGEQVYGKSVLYLVSRALEADHKTPLLGLEWALEDKLAEAYTKDIFNRSGRKAAEDWCARAREIGVTFHTHDEPQTSNGPDRIPATHGSFDNDVAVNMAMLERILGKPPEHEIKDLSIP